MAQGVKFPFQSYTISRIKNCLQRSFTKNEIIYFSAFLLGPVIQKFGFALSGWVILIFTGINAVLSALLPNTRDLWYNPATKEETSQEFDRESRRKLLSVSTASTEASPTPSDPPSKKSRCLALKQVR